MLVIKDQHSVVVSQLNVDILTIDTILKGHLPKKFSFLIIEYIRCLGDTKVLGITSILFNGCVVLYIHRGYKKNTPVIIFAFDLPEGTFTLFES